MSTSPDLAREEYTALAELRRQIRGFLHFSELTAKEQGLEPAQHQLLLAVHGLPEGVKPTIRELADRLFIQHHSAVELVNRLEKTGAVVRRHSLEDRREVLVHLTEKGKTQLRRLALAHRDELERSGPILLRTLSTVLRRNRQVKAS